MSATDRPRPSALTVKHLVKHLNSSYQVVEDDRSLAAKCSRLIYLPCPRRLPPTETNTFYLLFAAFNTKWKFVVERNAAIFLQEGHFGLQNLLRVWWCNQPFAIVDFS